MLSLALSWRVNGHNDGTEINLLVSQKLDSRQISRSFERAAANYDSAAELARVAAAELDEKLDFVQIRPARILDLGCGTGIFTTMLAARYPSARLFALDSSLAMLRQCQNKRLPETTLIAGDTIQPPLVAAGFDLICAGFLLEWCELETALLQIRKMMHSESLFVFVTLGPDTLIEITRAMQVVDHKRHVHQFHDMHIIGDSLLRCGFIDPVVDMERVEFTYSSVHKALAELKNTGAVYQDCSRREGLTGPRRMMAFHNAYQDLHGRDSVPLTFELIYGHCWA